ncbi:class I SAM-dependent methyltransferase [Streptomyces sp. NPDC060194]|uniref:class I SAM-dependent methyltransferase n=1 Tax=Streptomyces sp. NPDC060194 TaxID=3347069 RepID=UPI003659CE4B
MRPRSKESVRAFYADAVEHGKSTAEGLRSPTSAAFNRFLSTVGASTPRSALDLGYGMGAYTIALARAGFRVVAVDQVPSAPFRQRLRDHIEPTDRVEVVEELIERYPIRDAFGVVVAKDVLHYLAQNEVESLLGRAVAVSHPHSCHYLDVFTAISRTDSSGQIQRIEGEADFSPESLRRLVDRVYRGWHVSITWSEHAERDSRTDRNYFEAVRATVVAHRRGAAAPAPRKEAP